MTTKRELWRIYEQFLRGHIPTAELDEIEDAAGIDWGSVGFDIEFLQTDYAGVLHTLATRGWIEDPKFLEQECIDGTLFVHWDPSYLEPGYTVRNGRSTIDIAKRPELLETLLAIEDARLKCLSFIRTRDTIRARNKRNR